MKWKICLVKTQIPEELETRVCFWAGAICNNQAGYFLVDTFWECYCCWERWSQVRSSQQNMVAIWTTTRKLIASLTPSAHVTTCLFLFKGAPAILGRWETGRIKGEMRNSTLFSIKWKSAFLVGKTALDAALSDEKTVA